MLVSGPLSCGICVCPPGPLPALSCPLCCVFQPTDVRGPCHAGSLGSSSQMHQPREALAGDEKKGAESGQGTCCLPDRGRAVAGSLCCGPGSSGRPSLRLPFLLASRVSSCPLCPRLRVSYVCATVLPPLRPIFLNASLAFVTGHALHGVPLLSLPSVSCLTLTDKPIYERKNPSVIKASIPQEIHSSLRMRISGENSRCFACTFLLP